MDLIKGKEKKGLITKTWERCKSFGNRGGRGQRKNSTKVMMRKIKSWPGVVEVEDEKIGGKKQRVSPEGCFSVYVGPQKQRFVIKTEYINHPLFKVLLEEAELEYGYKSKGPLALPCNVDVFIKVLVEMDDCKEIPQGCNFVRSHSSYHHLSPSRMISLNNF